MSKHTAGFLRGPYEASGTGVWAISPWNARVRIAEVSTFSPMNGIDHVAHARLFAASPSMYAALEAAEQLARVGIFNAPDGLIDSVSTLREQAMALVRGSHQGP